jgi:hypothetical protein
MTIYDTVSFLLTPAKSLRRGVLSTAVWVLAPLLAPDDIYPFINLLSWPFYTLSLGRSISHGQHRQAPQDPRDPHSRARPLARAYLALTGGDPRTRQDPRVVHDDQPILAVKRVRLHDVWTAGLESGVARDMLLPANNATCLYASGAASYEHHAPAWDCSCGFYAVPADQLHQWPYPGLVAEVELSGVVIEHDRGYRAEHQRVVGLYDDGHVPTLDPKRRRAIEAAYGVAIRPSPWGRDRRRPFMEGPA